MNAEELRMILRDFMDEIVLDQIAIKRPQIRSDFHLVGGKDFSGGLVDGRINVELQTAFKHAAKRFQNSAFQIEVIFLVKNFDQTRNPQGQSNRSIGVARKIPGQPIVFPETGNNNGPAEAPN